MFLNHTIFIKIQSQTYACTRVLKDLQEKYDKVAEECRRYKKQCRILAKRLKDAGCKYNAYVYIYMYISEKQKYHRKMSHRDKYYKLL